MLFRPGKRGGAVIYKLSWFNWVFNGFNELCAELFLNAPLKAKIAVPFFFSGRLSPHALSARSAISHAFATI